MEKKQFFDLFIAGGGAGFVLQMHRGTFLWLQKLHNFCDESSNAWNLEFWKCHWKINEKRKNKNKLCDFLLQKYGKS